MIMQRRISNTTLHHLFSHENTYSTRIRSCHAPVIFMKPSSIAVHKLSSSAVNWSPPSCSVIHNNTLRKQYSKTVKRDNGAIKSTHDYDDGDDDTDSSGEPLLDSGDKGGPPSLLSKAQNKMSPMMYQYFKLKEQHKDYLLLFRMGDFYEMFFEDAVKASEVLHIALTKRGKHLGQDIPMCGIPHHALDTYLQKFLKAGVLVAICEQVEASAFSKNKLATKIGKPATAVNNSKILKRDVTRIVTPGTITEDKFLEARENNYLASLSFPNVVPNSKADKNDLLIGLSWLEMSTGEFQMTKTSLASLKSDLMRLSPSEVLIPCLSRDHYSSFPMLKQILQDYHITERQTDYFSSDSAREILSNRFPNLDANKFSLIELCSSGALLSYVLETQKGTLPYLDSPEEPSSREKYLSIDPATRSSLELIKTLSGEKRGSLLHTLDRTVTGPGARLLANRLASPLVDPSAINDRLDAIQYFIGDLNKIEEIREILKRVSDLERCLQRLNLSRGGPRDLHAIANSLLEAISLRSLILACNSSNKLKLPSPIKEAIEAMSCEAYDKVTHEIISALKSDPQELPATFSEGGFIREGYSSELDDLMRIRSDTKAIVDTLQDKYRKATGITTLKIKDNGSIGLFVEIPSSQRDKMSHCKQFHHIQTLTNAVRYKTDEIYELQTKIAGAEGSALTIELNVFADLQSKVIELTSNIITTAKAMASIDVYTSLALLSRERNYKRPKVLPASSEDLRFNIIGARHPTVELAQLNSGVGSFVSNDCRMSKQENRIMIITGPNMGGKSTYLRQNALIIIMAQFGCFVPAEKIEFSVVDKLFSRVGAMDNLAKDQSTFMVEMVETANILTQATSQSFVIMDEVGRGTATQDGLAIAWSIVEYLHSTLQCRTLFATHYHELTDIQRKLSTTSVGLYTLQVKEHSNRTLQFLYKISPGITSRSFGVHVAQFAGVPQPVVERAEAILKQLGEQNKKFHIE